MLKPKNVIWLSSLTAAVLCTANLAMGQSFETSDIKGGTESAGGTDGASCGGTQITQNTNPDLLVAGSIACGSTAGNADNWYARNFLISTATSVKCVDFGVESNNLPTNVRVRLYTHPTAGSPVTANMTLIPGSELQVAIPGGAGAALQFFSATYPGTGIAIPANTNLVVELFTPCRTAACVPPGDGGRIWIGSNSAGHSAPAYIKAPACGATFAEFVDLATAGFPNMHVVINLGTQSVDPCQVPLPACFADVAPIGGDGVVNANDLLAVINTWGQTQNPPGTGPRPQGDTSPLPNGNCLVNANDLLAVINNWGNCPAELRACCFSDGSCQTLGSADCTNAGGTWGDAGSTCTPNTCPVVPANDNCSGATQVFNGATNITNVGATDGTVPGASCTVGGIANFRRDVWYTYTATCTGNLTVDLCATTGSVTDTVLAMYTGTCTSLTEFACDDDACTGNPAGDLSRIVTQVTQGNTYFIRVGTWGGNAPGPMVLTIGCVVLNNDFCTDATTLTLGAAVNGNLATATQDSAPSCNGVGVTKGHWYTITSATDQTLTASTCGSDQNQGFDARLSVYCGLSCTSLFCVAASNSDSCGLFEQVSWCAKAGQQYWVLVHTDDAAGEGDYNLVVNGGASCSIFAACTFPGDECVSALTVVEGNNANLSNMGMTNSLGLGATTCLSEEEFTRDGWWNFTPTQTASYTFNLCASTQANFDSVIAIYSGTCSNLVNIACNDDACMGAGRSLVTVALTAGTQYKVRIGSWNFPEQWPGGMGAGGDFDLLISAAPPTGACCFNGNCSITTAAACAANCGSTFQVGQTCAQVTCLPNTPVGTTLCGANTLAGNGGHNTGEAANGTRPTAGWDNGNIGVMEDLVVCAGGNVNTVKVQMLDQTAAGTGTMSTYDQILVRIYPLNNSPITAIDWTNPPTPELDQVFTVNGTTVVKTLDTISFGSDVEGWAITLPSTLTLAPGTYGLYVSFPQLQLPDAGGGPFTFIATGGSSPNSTSPQRVHILNLTAGSAGASATQHSAMCVSP